MSLVFIELGNFSFFGISGWGTDLNNCDIEWFVLEMNRDHSVIFDTVPMYCISDSFVVPEGYSISSKGFLSTVVDLMVIWIKFTHPVCRSPAPASRDSTWREEQCRQVMRQSVSFLGLTIYCKFKIFFYTFTKALGERFDIFRSPSTRFIISINHCCSSEFLLQQFSRNQLYHLLSPSSYVSHS